MNDAMLYTTGANRIIAGGIVLSSPIVKEGQASILHIRNLLGLDLVIADKVPLYNISGLFSSFYYSSDMAAASAIFFTTWGVSMIISSFFSYASVELPKR